MSDKAIEIIVFIVILAISIFILMLPALIQSSGRTYLKNIPPPKKQTTEVEEMTTEDLLTYYYQTKAQLNKITSEIDKRCEDLGFKMNTSWVNVGKEKTFKVEIECEIEDKK